jgi:hypothetical protein
VSPPSDQHDKDISARPFAPEDRQVRPAPWGTGGTGVATVWPPIVGRSPSPEPGARAPKQGGDGGDDPQGADERRHAPQPADAPCPRCEVTRAQAVADRARLSAELLEPYVNAAQNLDRAVQELTDRFAENVVALAARMATAILHRDAEVDEQALIENIHRALQVVGPVTTLTLRCHPEDADVIRRTSPGLAAEISGRPVDVTVRPSSDVDRGSCIVLFEEGIVDARWQVQIDRIADAIRTTMTGQPLRPGRAEAAPPPSPGRVAPPDDTELGED